MTKADTLEDWINDYVGVPYVENGRDRADGWDCWGLVLVVYRERLGLELPDWKWRPPYGPVEKLRAFAGAVDLAGDYTTELAAPEAFALALVRGGQARAHHVGVVIAGGVLHAQRYGGTVWEPINRFAHNSPRVTWHRWRR